MVRFFAWLVVGCMILAAGCSKDVVYVPVTMKTESFSECNVQFQIPSNWGPAPSKISNHLKKNSESHTCEVFVQTVPRKTYPIIAVAKHYEDYENEISSMDEHFEVVMAIFEYDNIPVQVLKKTENTATILLSLESGEAKSILLLGVDDTGKGYVSSIVFNGTKKEIEASRPLIMSIADSASLIW